MILVDKMKNFKIYKTPTFLPTVPGNKKKGSAILLFTPNYESSKKIMESNLFINKLRYSSYYLERDISYYINDNTIEEVNENAIFADQAELDTYLEMSSAERNKLPDEMFGIPSKRKYPLDTEAHVRSAIKFFNYLDPKVVDKIMSTPEESRSRIVKDIHQYEFDINGAQNILNSLG